MGCICEEQLLFPAPYLVRGTIITSVQIPNAPVALQHYMTAQWNVIRVKQDTVGLVQLS